MRLGLSDGDPLALDSCTQDDIEVHVLCWNWYLYIPDRKVHVTTMGPIWGRYDLGGHHAGPMNIVIWDGIQVGYSYRGMNWIFYFDLTPSV